MSGGRDIDALVFDFDGLVLDTETSIFVAWREAFEAHGVDPLTHDEWSAEIGTIGGLDILGELRERAGRIDESALTRRVSRRDELLAGEEPLPGVLAWLDEADALGLGVAIASSSEAPWVLTHLSRLGLRERFGPVVCRNDVLAPKPAPDLYVEACRALNARPDASLAVEDSPHGVTAAKAAGLTCIAVPNSITRHLDLSAADLALGSLADRTLGEVLEALARR